MKKERFFDKWIVENGSYKIVALFVALVLWVAILGRKDFVLSHEMPIEVLVPAQSRMVYDIPKVVRVRIGGPRLALKRFKDSNAVLKIDLRRAGMGRTSLRIQESDFILPQKVRLISISPGFLSVDIAAGTAE